MHAPYVLPKSSDQRPGLLSDRREVQARSQVVDKKAPRRLLIGYQHLPLVQLRCPGSEAVNKVVEVLTELPKVADDDLILHSLILVKACDRWPRGILIDIVRSVVELGVKVFEVAAVINCGASWRNDPLPGSVPRLPPDSDSARNG